MSIALYDTATYQGKPCRYGHDGKRYSSTRHCVQCQKTRRRDDKLLDVIKGWDKKNANAYGGNGSYGLDPQFCADYLLINYPTAFDELGWRRATCERYDE